MRSTLAISRPAVRALPAVPLRRRWLPAGVVALTVVAMLLAIGTPPWDLTRYALYVCWGLVLPGTLCYRALRRTPHTLVEDLAIGAAVGFGLEIGAWAAFSALDARGWLWTWPLAVVVPFAAFGRRHFRPVGYARVPPAWSWTVALIALVLFGYLVVAFLGVNPPVPSTGSRLYFVDQMYLLSLVGEAKQHIPLSTPQVAGQPLAYHWFTFAHEASASLVSGVDTPMVHFRLFLPVVSVLGVLLLAVTGWRLSGRPWVGALAAALTFVVGELAVGSFAASPMPAVTAYITWSSNSVPYGWLYMFPLLVMIADRLRPGRPPQPAIGAGAWPLMGFFAVGASGAKSTILPVLLGGLGLALLRRRFRDRPLWAVFGVCLAAQLFATVVLYRFATHGVVFRPLVVFHQVYHATQERPLWKEALVVGFVFGSYLTYMFVRLAGIPVLARLTGRSWGPVEWVLLGGLLAGVAGTLLLYDPALGQNYFLRTGFPLGAILSAMGYAALVERFALPVRTVGLVVVGSVAVASGVSVVLWRLGGGEGGTTYRAMLPMARPAVVILCIAALLVGCGRAMRQRGLGATAAVTVLLLAGAPGLVWDAYIYPNELNYYHERVSAAEVSTMRWLRSNSSPDDLVATNHHLHPTLFVNNSFWLTAYSERRFLVEAWGYTPRSVQDAARWRVGAGMVPFWDPDLLARNDAAFIVPTAENVGWLRRRGVRWLVADSGAGPVSARLRDFAVPRVAGGSITVYELADAPVRRPEHSTGSGTTGSG